MASSNSTVFPLPVGAEATKGESVYITCSGIVHKTYVISERDTNCPYIIKYF